MYRAFEGLLDAALDAAIAGGELVVSDRPACRLEEPSHPVFGDATSRVALAIARRTGRPAPDVAHTLVRHVADPRGWVELVEAAGPGFVNLRASLAFWRAALAAVVRDAPVVVPGRGRAVVLRSGDDVRATMVADAMARLLAGGGFTIERAVGPVDALAGCTEAAAVRRVVAVHGADDRLATRRAKEAFARAGGRPGDVTGIALGPLQVRHRGRAVAAHDVPAALATPAARFALAGIPIGAPAAVDLERVASDRIDNPWVAVRYALTRIARVVGSGPGEPDDLAALDERDRECLRGVGFHADVVDVAVRRLAPDLLAAHACDLAAAFHRHYNRGAFTEARAVRARRVLAQGVGRMLEATLTLLDASPVEGV